MGEFRMPSLGADMEEGTLVEWLKAPGDPVARGDIIAVVETQKGAIEIEVFQAGRIATLLIEPGDTVPVGAPMALIEGIGAAPAAPPAAIPEPETPELAVPERPAPEAPTAVGPPPAAIHARPAVAAKGRASPAARRLAAESGIDLATLTGSGPDGAIVSSDVAAAEPDRTAKRRGLDLGEMRKAIAAAMARSKREIPHYYLDHTIDLTAAQSWLEAANAGRPPTERLLIGAVLLKAAARALAKRPGFNGFFTGERFRPSKAVHAGVAIAIRGGGLVSPALHDADTRPLPDLMQALRDLVARARQGRRARPGSIRSPSHR